MTGHPITAEDAYKQGLASRVVPEEELNNEISKIVSAIKNKSRSVLALGKEFFYQQLELSQQEAYKQGTKVLFYMLVQVFIIFFNKILILFFRK